MPHGIAEVFAKCKHWFEFVDLQINFIQYLIIIESKTLKSAIIFRLINIKNFISFASKKYSVLIFPWRNSLQKKVTFKAGLKSVFESDTKNLPELNTKKNSAY